MNEMKVLDHGYLKYIEHWGSDERIIEAARMSTDKGFLGWGPKPCDAGCEFHDGIFRLVESEINSTYWIRCSRCNGTGKIPGDEKLLRYLYENKHSTPFEMAGLVIEVQAPIFVFREWHRHRTQSYSELSARYTPMPNLNYVPTVERLMMNSKTNKQAGAVKGADELSLIKAEAFQSSLHRMYAEQEELYQCALSDGVPKELARIHLPVGRYSRMRAQALLRNWLAFLTLRMAPNAMWEIRTYSEVLAKMLRELFPRTMELFDGKRN